MPLKVFFSYAHEDETHRATLEKHLTLLRRQAAVLVPQRESIMPELLLRDLTAEQVADLLAYLESLK